MFCRESYSNSKQKGGAVGALSDGLITRQVPVTNSCNIVLDVIETNSLGGSLRNWSCVQTYYEHCLCLALIPFKQEDEMYPADFPERESVDLQ